MTGAVLAHAADWATPETLWSHWLGDPLVAVGLVAVAGLYAAGVGQLWRRHGRGAVVRRWQAAAFAVGLLLVAAVTVSPLDGAAHALLWVHMVQHLVLVLAVAPLLALGAPVVPLLTALPASWRDRAHRLRASAATRRLLHSFAGVAAACAAHVVVMWVWHVPPLYEAALRWTLVHGLEHATMLGTAMWVWGTIVQRGGPLRRPRPTGAVAMFLIGTLTVGLAPLMTFSTDPWYATYAERTLAWGLEPLADQQMAGGLMWGLGGVFYPLAGAVLFALWLHRDGRSSPADGGPATSPWWHDRGVAARGADPERPG